MVNVVDAPHRLGVTERFGPVTVHTIVFTSAPGATVAVTVRAVDGAGTLTVGVTCVNA